MSESEHTSMSETVSATAAIDLLRAAFPDLPVERYEFAGEGYDSVALLINGERIFRFAKRPDVAIRQAREAELLPLLMDRLPLAVPRYTHVWADPAWPGKRIVGYPIIHGEQIFADRARPEHRAAQAAQLGAFVTALHAIPVDEARRHGALGGDATSWRDEYRAFYELAREHMLPLFDANERAAIEAFWRGYLVNDDNFAFAPALVHRDLNTEHILFDPATGRLTGVIDWGDASIGDPAIDFTAVRRELGEDFSRRMLAAYEHPRDASFTRRMNFYNRLIPFHEIRFGQVDNSPMHVERGLAMARQQLREASDAGI